MTPMATFEHFDQRRVIRIDNTGIIELHSLRTSYTESETSAVLRAVNFSSACSIGGQLLPTGTVSQQPSS